MKCPTSHEMDQEEVLKLFRECGALLNGHFILRSGRHSRIYFQCAYLLQYPWVAERLCSSLARKMNTDAITHVISPAMGGILVGHEIARALRKPHFFTEKKNGRLELRRFQVEASMRFLVAEDVVTSGSAIEETAQIVREKGGTVVAVAALVCRSENEIPDFRVPFYYLVRLPVETFDPQRLPEDLKNIPAIKLGS
jgi:orotate phosphoribosyltransferase